MKTVYALALYRSDLDEMFKNTHIDEIVIAMFPFFKTGVMLHEDVILFIDEDGTTRILKNRLGK